MAAYSVPESAVARVLPSTRRSCASTIAMSSITGQIKATAKVAESLFRKATTDGAQSVTAAIFWLKTRGGWRETAQNHQVAVTDVTKLSDEELERMIGMLQTSIAEQTPKPRRSPAVPR